MKKCKRCGEFKSESEFYKDKTTRDKLRGKCISCLKAEHQEYRDTHKEQEKIYRKGYLRTHKAERKATN